MIRGMEQRNVIAGRLKELRLSAGLTLSSLAEKAGMHLQGLAKIESGQRPNPGWETVLALAEALEVTPDAFLEPKSKGRGKKT